LFEYEDVDVKIGVKLMEVFLKM